MCVLSVTMHYVSKNMGCQVVLLHVAGLLLTFKLFCSVHSMKKSSFLSVSIE